MISSGIKIEYSSSFKIIITIEKNEEETKILNLFQLVRSLTFTILT